MRPQPYEVFTPRFHEINPYTYVARSKHEVELRNALYRTQHVVLTGDSGAGKTWLYKKVLSDAGIPSETLNLSIASKFGDLDSAFRAKLAENDVSETTSVVVNKEAGFTPWGMGGFKASRTETSGHFEPDPVAVLFSHMNKKYNGKKSVLVLENFEQIIRNTKIVKQVSDLIMLLDDPYYGNLGVKLIVVCVPSHVSRIMASAATSSTISNRLYELQEIGRLEVDEANELVRKGFSALGIINAGESFANTVSWLTNRGAQHMQQLCLCVAEGVVGQVHLTDEILQSGVRRWLNTSLMPDYEDVMFHLQSAKSEALRLRQLLYVMSRTTQSSFSSKALGIQLKQSFQSTLGCSGRVRIDHILRQLASSSRPLIRIEEGSETYHFVKPTYRLILRSLAARAQDDQVQFGSIEDGISLPKIQVVEKVPQKRENLNDILTGYGS